MTRGSAVARCCAVACGSAVTPARCAATPRAALVRFPALRGTTLIARCSDRRRAAARRAEREQWDQVGDQQRPLQTSKSRFVHASIRDQCIPRASGMVAK